MILRGPRPMPLHQSLALSCWQSALLAWHASKRGWPIWNPNFAAKAAPLAAAFQNPEFPAALWQEMQRRFEQFQRGVQCYHAQPPSRADNPYPVLWQDGSTRLLDYGGSGAPVLLIPSLVNRAYILDLLPQKSFVQYLREQGLHPLLVDWGTPQDQEKNFGLNDYITQRLWPVLENVTAQFGAPHVMGYCMGGNLALALAATAPHKPRSLTLLATPWDFHAAGMPRFSSSMAEQVLAMATKMGELPVDWLQSFFAALDPFGTVEKFMRFAEKDLTSDGAQLFVALEDWLSDGVPLPIPVARDTLLAWYGHNTPMRGEWRVGGMPILPQQINLPTLAVLPQQDRIVSPASAAALANLIPGAMSLTPSLGHIGMMTGREAEALVWAPVANWLKAH
jgi:polyhydroxyalkanoate synthase